MIQLIAQVCTKLKVITTNARRLSLFANTSQRAKCARLCFCMLCNKKQAWHPIRVYLEIMIGTGFFAVAFKNLASKKENSASEIINGSAPFLRESRF